MFSGARDVRDHHVKPVLESRAHVGVNDAGAVPRRRPALALPNTERVAVVKFATCTVLGIMSTNR
jgi:hypothetical protein